MGRWRITCVFLGIILIFSLLIQGICTAQGISETNTSPENTTNKTQSPSWIILLPIFFGCLLFLGWVCRYFEEASLSFVLFMIFLLCEISLLLILNAGLFYNFIKDKQTLDKIFIFASLFIIIPIALLYLYPNKYDKTLRNLLPKMRSVNIIGMALVWPAILIYYYVNGIESVVFNGSKELSFPVYVITASYIGIISYLLLSIEETFSHLVPEYKKLSIVWSYLRRIFIAPFIAIISYYLLNDLVTLPEGYEVKAALLFIFSFFVGVFTKTIEEWIYDWVQKILPENRREEFRMRDQYDVEKSDFVRILGLDEDVAYWLYHANIKTIDDLAVSNTEDLEERLNRDKQNDSPNENCKVKSKCYSHEQINRYIQKAEIYRGINKSGLVTELKMDKELALKLFKCVNITTIDDLSTRNKTYILNRFDDCNESVSEDEIETYINKALKYSSIDKSKLVTELKINKGLIREFFNLDIYDIKKLSTSNEKDIHEKLPKEIQQNVSIDTIDGYIKDALKYMADHPNEE